MNKNMLELEKVHPDGIYLSGALLMFAGNKSYHLRMIIVISYLTIICNLL